MRFPTTPPRLTRQGVLRLFLNLLDATPEQTFAQTDLARLQLPSHRYARTLLTFLDVLTDSSHLRPEFFHASRCPEDLRHYLGSQVRRGCQRVDDRCDVEKLAQLGSEDLADYDVRRLILEAMPSIAEQGRDQAKSNMISCLRGIHHVMLHCDDRAWIEREAGTEPTEDTPTRNDHLDIAGGDESSELASANSGGLVGGSGSRDALRYDRKSSADSVYHLGDFDIDVQGERIVKAHVYLDVPATSERIKHLALRLLGKAQELRDLELTQEASIVPQRS